jgi:hypothetical protein
MENLSNDFPLFRLTDFYLMKAECEIRLDVIVVTNGSIPSEPEPVWIRYNGCTLDQLLEERGREMYAEGHRRQDLNQIWQIWNSPGGKKKLTDLKKMNSQYHSGP